MVTACILATKTIIVPRAYKLLGHYWQAPHAAGHVDKAHRYIYFWLKMTVSAKIDHFGRKNCFGRFTVRGKYCRYVTAAAVITAVSSHGRTLGGHGRNQETIISEDDKSIISVVLVQF